MGIIYPYRPGVVLTGVVSGDPREASPRSNRVACIYTYSRAVRNPSAMQETWVRSLGWEDPLEEGMATPSSILAWRSPWTEEPGGVQFMGWQRVGLD